MTDPAEHGDPQHDQDDHEDVLDLGSLASFELPGGPLLDLVNDIASRVARRPVKVRAKVTPQGLLRGYIDVLVVEVRELPVAKLIVDRLVMRAEKVRIRPGFPPRLQASPVGWKAVVCQERVDGWTRALRLPVRLELTDEGIVAHGGLAGVSMGQVLTELEPVGPLLRLRPVRASFLGMSAPAVGVLRGYLPVPPMPAGARLDRIEPDDGEISVYFTIDDIDQALTPDLVGRIRKRFSIG